MKGLAIYVLTRWRIFRRNPEKAAKEHIASLAKAAKLEMSMGIGSYLDTLAQIRDLTDQLEATRKKHRAAEDDLFDRLRFQLSHLEAVVHRREIEYDDLQERYCALKERAGSA